jgi:peptide/nickel transport system substrate-binding protein
MIGAIAASIDPEERDLLILKDFTFTYEQYTDLPMASIAAEVTVNPEVVADWVFPGVTSTGLSHWHLITAASD